MDPFSSRKATIDGVHLTLGEEVDPREVALELLCRLHWKRLFGIALAAGNGVEDSEDLTQSFLGDWIGRKQYLTYNPSRGSLRAFLVASFRNFLIDDSRKRNCLRRGGNTKHVSIESAGISETIWAPDPGHHEPGTSIDQSWALGVLRQAVKRLRDEYTSNKKGALFDAIEAFITSGGSALEYEKAGSDLGMSEAAIRNAVFRLRKRLGKLLRSEFQPNGVGSDSADDSPDGLLVALLAVGK